MQSEKTYLHHVVFISFHKDVDESIKKEIIERYTTLGEDCGGREKGILFWSAKQNIDTRKGIHFVEIGIFEDQKSFENFKKHPKHIAVVELLKASADWYVGDIVDVFPEK